MWNTAALLAQLLTISGGVRDAASGQAVRGATVQAVGSPIAALTDSNGDFTYTSSLPLPVRLRVSRSGYATREVVAERAAESLKIRLTPAILSLEGVTVTAIRGEAADGAPIAQRTLQQEEIERRYSGQEMPFLLAMTPSVTTYSDGGAYSNYTYFRIRGIDQTRVNITLDGVPLNDAEDQGVFFSNFPDLGNSIQSIQVQRGVGTSSLGVGSFAGNVNFESIALAGARRGGEVQLSRGDFNTTRGSAEWLSGMTDGGFAAYGRLSRQETDGYRRNSGNSSTGGFASAGWFGDRSSVKLTLLGGVSRNGLAYLASPLSEIRTDPRHNPLPSTDRDRFTQSLASLALTRQVGPASTVSATAYTVTAGGDYDVTIGSDILNFNLASQVMGALATFNAQRGKLTVRLGSHANTYWRDHFLRMRPQPDGELYRNRGRKKEASVFGKASYEAGRASFFGDLQLRRVWYTYLPDANAGIDASSIAWGFANPRIGASWALAGATSSFVSWGLTGREPARNDLFAGFDNIDTSNVDFVGPLSNVRPEYVNNWEAGLAHRGGTIDLSASAFLMLFRDEITPVGELSYIGLPLRKNVESSRRRGIEVDLRYRGVDRLLLAGSATFSNNRIAQYTDDASQRTFRDVPPLLTPSFVANQSADLELTRSTTLGVVGRYVSRSYLANDGDDRFVTPQAWLLDASVRQRFGSLEVMAHLRNALNREFFAGGYHDGTSPSYYVTPPRNLTVTMKAVF
ncbi:MAG: TonB-dependent receptor [Gemmatimonadota bacterium]